MSMWLIISDSHDNMEKIKKAVEIAKAHEVDRVIHLGDFVSPFALLPFLIDEWEFNGIFGNNDGEKLFLQKKANGRIKNSPNWLNVDGKRIYLMHEPRSLYPAIKSGLYDLVLFGHTHRLVLKRYGKTIVINPGESCGYLTGNATCVIFDPKTLESKVIEL